MSKLDKVPKGHIEWFTYCTLYPVHRSKGKGRGKRIKYMKKYYLRSIRMEH